MVSNEKLRLLAVDAAGENVCTNFPNISTQESGRIYYRNLQKCTEGENDSPIKQENSMVIVSSLKHLNLLPFYLKETKHTCELTTRINMIPHS